MTDGLKFCRDCRALHTPGYCPWPEIERTLAEDKRAVRAIASFPLPGEGTSRDNYRRVLAWLYDGGRESVASLVIDLTMADMERERAERLAPQAPPDASVADAVVVRVARPGAVWRAVAGGRMAMVDVVLMLRRVAQETYGLLLTEAADAIERLRADNDRLRGMVDAALPLMCAADWLAWSADDTERLMAAPVDPLASMYPTRAVCAALNRRDAEMRERMSAQKAAIEREAFDAKPVEDQRTIKAGEWKPATQAELREAVEAVIAGLARIKGGDLS